MNYFILNYSMMTAELITISLQGVNAPFELIVKHYGTICELAGRGDAKMQEIMQKYADLEPIAAPTPLTIDDCERLKTADITIIRELFPPGMTDLQIAIYYLDQAHEITKKIALNLDGIDPTIAMLLQVIFSDGAYDNENSDAIYKTIVGFRDKIVTRESSRSVLNCKDQRQLNAFIIRQLIAFIIRCGHTKETILRQNAFNVMRFTHIKDNLVRITRGECEPIRRNTAADKDNYVTSAVNIAYNLIFDWLPSGCTSSQYDNMLNIIDERTLKILQLNYRISDVLDSVKAIRPQKCKQSHADILYLMALSNIKSRTRGWLMDNLETEMSALVQSLRDNIAIAGSIKPEYFTNSKTSDFSQLWCALANAYPEIIENAASKTFHASKISQALVTRQEVTESRTMSAACAIADNLNVDNVHSAIFSKWFTDSMGRLCMDKFVRAISPAKTYYVDGSFMVVFIQHYINILIATGKFDIADAFYAAIYANAPMFRNLLDAVCKHIRTLNSSEFPRDWRARMREPLAIEDGKGKKESLNRYYKKYQIAKQSGGKYDI